jgi:RNA polymerase sigma-B factor
MASSSIPSPALSDQTQTPASTPTKSPVAAQGRRLRRRTALERRNQLVEAHRELVRPIALHYCRCSPEPLDDLIQVGQLGLIRAAELFQRSQGTPFGAFARPHIRGAILHHLRDCAPAVRLPRRQAELQEKLLRLQRLNGTGGTPGGLEQARKVLGIDAGHLEMLLRQRQLNRPLSLLATHEDQILDHEHVNQDDDHLGGGGAERLLATLEPRQRLVVQQVVLAGMSYRQLARRMAVSPMTVQRLLHRGLEHLRWELKREATPASLPLGPGRSVAPAC